MKKKVQTHTDRKSADAQERLNNKHWMADEGHVTKNVVSNYTSEQSLYSGFNYFFLLVQSGQ